MAGELDDVGPGTLKVVVAPDEPVIAKCLRRHVPEQHVRPAGRGAWIVFTEAEPAEIRDWVAAVSGDASVFVVEFERWSGQGDIDREWLLRRGH
jgi:hypothetical protein